MMKLLNLLLTMLLLLFIVGCNSNKKPLASSAQSPSPSESVSVSPTPTTDPSPTPTEEVKQPSVDFQISSFKVNYEINNIGTITSHNYNGEGIITVSGDPALSKKSYLVLVYVKKLSGGDEYHQSRWETVIVSNGIGSFTTTDWGSDSNKIDKPVYEALITAYMPFKDIHSLIVRSD